MKFFTAQPASRVSAIRCGKDVVPDWSKHPLTDPNAKAYRYLLDIFNENNATSAPGLIFGYAFNDLDVLRKAVLKAGMPSGAYFPDREMLVVNVPEEIPTLSVDFYRFSDLIYGFGDSMILPLAIRDLLEPNGKTFELPVTHIPLIKAEWVTEIIAGGAIYGVAGECYRVDFKTNL